MLLESLHQLIFVTITYGVTEWPVPAAVNNVTFHAPVAAHYEAPALGHSGDPAVICPALRADLQICITVNCISFVAFENCCTSLLVCACL